MKTYLVLCSLFIIISSGFGQDLNNSQEVISSNGAMLYSFDNSDPSVQGSPYIQTNFLPAKVSAKNDQIFNLRYNAINDEIEIESEQKNNPTINKNIPGITITFLKDNKTYKSMTYFSDEGDTITGFLIPISNANAKVKLFAKERIRFVEGKPAKSSYQDAVPPKFERLDDNYFIAIDNKIAQPLSNNKKEIAAMFPAYEKDILKYVSSERLNVKREDDLIKLVNHLNQVIQ